jgi:hypothetical protein
MAITDSQIADLRDAFQRIEAHITELEARLIAVLDTLELGDDEPELALELGDDQSPPF